MGIGGTGVCGMDAESVCGVDRALCPIPVPLYFDAKPFESRPVSAWGRCRAFAVSGTGVRLASGGRSRCHGGI